MVSNDKGDEYLCVCGKVFRRQLALERHVDIHHSSKSVSRKCDVCGKTFGSRNTLTMHRAIHADSADQQSSRYFERVSSGSENPTELSDLVLGQGADETCATDQLVYVVSASQDVKEDTVDGICKSIETQATDVPNDETCRPNEDKSISNISSSTDTFILDSTPNHTDHIEEQKESSAGGVPVSAAVRFRKQSLLSNVFETNYATDQSMDFSDMVVEEIVSESLLQTANQLPESFVIQHWSKSDQYLNLSAPDDPTSNEAKCQNVESPELLQKRINKVKPETRKSQEKLRQSRNSEEKRVDVELIEEFEGDSGQKEAINLATTRHLHSSRTPFVCGICHKNFDSEKYLSMHMPLHKPYIDPLAGDGKIVTRTSIEIQELIDMHGQSVTKQKKTTTTDAQHWTCQYCNKLFMQNSNYKNHMRTHSDERPFVCEICNIGFKERYHLKKHVLFKHTTDLKEKCRVCGKCFKDSTAVRAHERIHSEIRPYSCQLCEKTFKTSECLWHHENRSKTCGKSVMRRADAAANSPSSSTAILPDRTDMAPMRRTRKPRLGGGGASRLRTPRRLPMASALDDNDHTKQYTTVIDDKMGSEIETCVQTSVLSIKTEPECDLFDPNLQTYINDDQELESILEIFGGNANKDVSCAEETGSDLTDSDNGFVTKDSEDFSVKYKGLECTKCVKKFSSTATFEKHMVMHNEERPYRCTLCDNGFKLKVHLKKHHLYRHSNEYPCECSICGKRFKDSSAVRLHEKIHSSDRPFRCHCGKGFKTRENLWGHRNRGPCEKTQDFITNNIGLFRTTEFGPILGVPITNGHSLVASSNLAAPFTTSSFINTSRGTTDINQLQVQTNMKPVLLKTTQGTLNVPHSMQFIPSCVISSPEVTAGQTSRQLKVATLKFIKPRSNDVLTQQTAVIPTAIVTPLVRDGTVPPVSSHQGSQTHNQSTTKTVASKSTSQLQLADSRAGLLSYHTTSSASRLIFTRTKKLKNNVTDTAHILSAAEKCPTVQKFLEMDSITSNKSPAINHLLGNSVVLENRCDSDTIIITPKRRKLNSIGDDNSSTEGEDKASRSQRGDHASIVCANSIGLIEQESQDSRSLSYIDPLLTNSPQSSSHLSIYPGMDDYDDMKYDPNDPTLNIGDVYWGDSDNTLSSGWLLENDSLFSDLSLTSTFGTL